MILSLPLHMTHFAPSIPSPPHQSTFLIFCTKFPCLRSRGDGERKSGTEGFHSPDGRAASAMRQSSTWTPQAVIPAKGRREKSGGALGQSLAVSWFSSLSVLHAPHLWLQPTPFQLNRALPFLSMPFPSCQPGVPLPLLTPAADATVPPLCNCPQGWKEAPRTHSRPGRQAAGSFLLQALPPLQPVPRFGLSTEEPLPVPANVPLWLAFKLQLEQEVAGFGCHNANGMSSGGGGAGPGPHSKVEFNSSGISTSYSLWLRNGQG